MVPERLRSAPTLPGEPDLGAWYTEAELIAAERAIRESADWRKPFEGHYRNRFEQAFGRYVGAEFAIATNSAGTGLDMAMAALDAEPGDEVVSCAVNFPGTHLAVIGRGLRLVLCEPDPRTLNLDPARLAEVVSPRTVAVLVTHMNGLPADLAGIEGALAGIQTRRPVRIVCDAARACGAGEPGGRVGRRGWVTVFSFQRKKAMTTLGEGGMLTTDCRETAAKLRRLQSFGAGEDWGTSYKMTEVQAAVGLVQLARLDQMNDARIALARLRTAALRTAEDRLLLPPEPPGFRHIFLLYTLLLAPGFPASARDRLVSRLESRHAIGCALANPPTYRSNRLIRRVTQDQGRFPIADGIGDRVFCPALHPCMTAEECRHVTEALLEELSMLDGQG